MPLVAKVQKVRTGGAEVVETNTIDLTPRAKAFVKAYNDIATTHRKWVLCTNKYLDANPESVTALNQFVDSVVQEPCPKASKLGYFKLNTLPFAT